MRWLSILLKRFALYVLGSLALVLGLFFGAQLLFPDLRQEREIADAVLFKEIAREDQSKASRQRLRVVIVSAHPIASDLDAIHASLMRQAAKRLQAASGADAVRVVLVHSEALLTAPALGEATFAKDGKGWSGDQNWQLQIKQPRPALPKGAEAVLLAAKAYLDATPKSDRSLADLEAQILAQVPGFDGASIRRILNPDYSTQQRPIAAESQ